MTSWKTQADASRQLNALTEFCRTIWDEVGKIKQTKASSVDFFPFKIYSIPSYLYTYPDTLNERWRTFKVREGCVLTSIVSTGSRVFGTDGIKFSDNVQYAIPPESGSIVVPISSSQYWIWIEQLTASLPITGTYVLRHGADPSIAGTYNPNPWVSFPIATGSYIPIGFIDTQSSGSVGRAYVRQFLRNDVLSSGGGGNGNYISTSICVDGEVQTWYVDMYRSGTL
jgi:hypothetical protein